MFQFWLSGAGGARGLLDIDDTVREIIYEGTITQLHRYLRKLTLPLFVWRQLKGNNWLDYSRRSLAVVPRSALYSKPLSET